MPVASLPTPDTTISKKYPEKRQLHVFPIGDLFQERYYVPTVADNGDSPITHPEPMRGKSAVRSTQIPSGTELHANVLKAIVEGLGTERLSPSVPPTLRPQVVLPTSPKAEDWRVFNTFLHELGAFPAMDTTEGTKQKVWRISDTKGLVEDDDGDILTEADKRRAHAEGILNDQIREATARIRALDNDSSVLLVINDRNQGFRRCDSSLADLFSCLEEKYATDGPAENVLILWHTRTPMDRTRRNYLVTRLSASPLRHNVLVVINQQCLRDAGVNLRFDISYEHTLKDLLDFSQMHRLLKSLLLFPQVLVRYDYGVLHITTDEICAENSRSSLATSTIKSVDIHGMVGGPFYISHTKYGMIPGRTFLLVASLVREIVCWFYHDTRISLADVMRLEGTAKRFENVKEYLDEPMGSSRIPSILRNSVIDQGIDLGILLNAHHFYRGFGPSDLKQPPGTSVRQVATHFGDLVKDFDDQVRVPAYSDTPIGKDIKDQIRPFAFKFNHAEPKRTRLTRFCLDRDLLDSDLTVTIRRETFSRVEMLKCQEILDLASEKDMGHPKKSATQQRKKIPRIRLWLSAMSCSFF